MAKMYRFFCVIRKPDGMIGATVMNAENKTEVAETLFLTVEPKDLLLILTPTEYVDMGMALITPPKDASENYKLGYGYVRKRYLDANLLTSTS